MDRDPADLSLLSVWCADINAETAFVVERMPSAQGAHQFYDASHLSGREL
jgi:hypothetical protein